MKKPVFIEKSDKLTPHLGLIMRIILEKYSSKVTNIDIANEIVNEIATSANGVADTSVSSIEVYVSNFRKLVQYSYSDNLTSISAQGFSLLFYFILKERTFSEFTYALGLLHKYLQKKHHVVNEHAEDIRIDNPQDVYDFFNQIKSEDLALEGLNFFAEALEPEIPKICKYTDDDTKTYIYNYTKKERDTDAIKKIKIQRGEECQICRKYVLMSDGSKYVEAAHITPKNENGVEKPFNILILCPNHHKEFDLGKREIIERNESFIRFKLNEIEYKLDLN